MFEIGDIDGTIVSKLPESLDTSVSSHRESLSTSCPSTDDSEDDASHKSPQRANPYYTGVELSQLEEFFLKSDESFNTKDRMLCPEKATSTETDTKTKGATIYSFTNFRFQYILAYTCIMLADGLQGTHLYILYESYGFSVASLYSLGFMSGAFSSPFTGAFVDKFGRKKAVMLYCLLEIIINYMEQYPVLICLVLSRVIGGITTNLLCSCFETWLVTEHRKRGFGEENLEIMLRDSGVVSNSAAILSGFLAHFLASTIGPVGPFQGAVATTFLALVVVACLWTENYGESSSGSLSICGHMVGAFETIKKDSKISRIGLIQGLVEGSLQTFVFLWSPALRMFATSASARTLGLDQKGDPAYGLIFGAFMTSAVLGGFSASTSRKLVARFLSRKRNMKERRGTDDNDAKDEEGLDPLPVNLVCSLCYMVGAALFLIPCVIPETSPHAFSVCLGSFMVYEFVVGLYVPSEGIVRSIYMPTESMCSIINILRIITNVAVALGVISTNKVPIKASFAALAMMMMTASILTLTLILPRDYFMNVSMKRYVGPFLVLFIAFLSRRIFPFL